MKNTDYQIIDRNQKKELTKFLSKEGQLLLPMLDLIEQSQAVVDQVIDVVGRATIEAVLFLSAQQIAGPQHKGKDTGDVRWHGRQKGVVSLSERKLRVDKPRLRRKGKAGGLEVLIPAYNAMQLDSRLGQRMLSILMHGISTRVYKDVLPQMSQTVGVSKSSVSREFIEASEQVLAAFAQRRFDDKDILIIYIDGLIFGGYHVIAAVGVDSEGYKHVLGLAEGASENAVVVKDLLEDIVSRGVKAGRRRLFVIDGSKALRNAIDAVFGKDNPVQRCRKHKIANVTEHLPREMKQQVCCVMRAAYRLGADEGIRRLEQQAGQLELLHPSAAASLREGLEETFTVNCIGLPSILARSLHTTNIIESPHAGVRMRTGRVCNWRDGKMVLRWATVALLETEKHFHRIAGYKQLWVLKSYLDRPDHAKEIAIDRKAG